MVLLVLLYLVNPSLPSSLAAFVSDFENKEVAPYIFLPAPKSNHPELYFALFQFSMVFGFMYVLATFFRFAERDRGYKKAATISNLVFWFGLALLSVLLRAELVSWFAFVGFLAVLFLALIVARLYETVYFPG